MSCTWTIFEGERSLKGEEDDSQGVRSHEEGGNGKFNYRQSKRRKGKYGEERETEMRQNNLWMWGE